MQFGVSIYRLALSVWLDAQLCSVPEGQVDAAPGTDVNGRDSPAHKVQDG